MSWNLRQALRAHPDASSDTLRIVDFIPANLNELRLKSATLNRGKMEETCVKHYWQACFACCYPEPSRSAAMAHPHLWRTTP